MSILNSGQITILETIKELAKERREYYRKIGGNSGDPLEIMTKSATPEYQIYQVKERKLRDFLLELDIQMIRVVQSVMYIGRDEDKNYVKDSVQLYEGYFQETENILASKKSIQVSRIVEKLPLDEYLEKGMDILFLRV